MPANVWAIAEQWLIPSFYADPDQMRASIRLGIMFNIIDTSQARKVDLIPVTMKPGYGFALANRIRREIFIDADTTLSAWFAKPEDVIVGKLMAWQEGHSFKHEADIRDILTAVQLGDDVQLSASFDPFYIDRWAAKLGWEVEQFWQAIKKLLNPDDVR